MLNGIFVFLIAVAVITASFTGKMPEVTDASLASAKSAVEIAIGLIGQMALWLGLMAVVREAGLLRSLGRLLRPLMVRLFPDVPPDHPAMGAMILNISANLLGLGNAATPFGLKAMAELNKLNTRPGVATNAMALFLVLNNAGITAVPLNVIAQRASLGSKDAASIAIPSLLGTIVTAVIAVLVAKTLARAARFAPERYPATEAAAPAATAAAPEEGPDPKAGALQSSLALLATVALVIGAGVTVHTLAATMKPSAIAWEFLSRWLLPLVMIGIVLVGYGRQVKVYEVFVNGAKEGFQIAVTIIPFLVAILVAVGMLRASGALGAFVDFLKPVTTATGFPGEAVMMALIRPLSGQGAYGVMTDAMKTYGPDSPIGYLVSLLNGSSETTFYVLALYFGSIQVKAIRHTLLACLASDAVGLVVTTITWRAFYG